jgi:hypothetical protein
VETHAWDERNSLTVSRDIYDGDAEVIETFSAMEGGICVKYGTRIERRF